MSDIAIHAENLCRSFKLRQRNEGVVEALKAFVKPQYVQKHAVKNMNFSIPRGNVVGLVGANGAGKTTLLKMISGLLHPTGGSINVLGFTPHERKPEFLRRIGMVMGQKSQLWTDIPAIDTFALLASIYKLERSFYEKQIHELSERFGVSKLLGTQVRRLSLGERMKLEIIAALLHKPDLLILDEPTIGLDILAKDIIRDFVKTHNKETGTTILLSSHDMEDISELCQELMVVHNGELVFADSLKAFTANSLLKHRVQEILSQ